MVRIIEYFTLYTAICRVYDVKSASVVGGLKISSVISTPALKEHYQHLINSSKS